MGKTGAGDRRNNIRHDNIKLVTHRLLCTEKATAANKLKAKSKSFPLHATGEVEVQLHLFLNSVLDGSKWSVANPGRFTPAQESPASIE
jgi:hypothetical protein